METSRTLRGWYAFTFEELRIFSFFFKVFFLDFRFVGFSEFAFTFCRTKNK